MGGKTAEQSLKVSSFKILPTFSFFLLVFDFSVITFFHFPFMNYLITIIYYNLILDIREGQLNCWGLHVIQAIFGFSVWW